MEQKKMIVRVLGSLILFLLTATYSYADFYLTWNAVAGDVTGYKIYYGETIGDYTNCKNAGNVTKYYLDALGLDENETYYFVIRAYNDYGESTDSNYIKFDTPLLIDSIPPEINITSQAIGYISETEESTLSLLGISSDNVGVTLVTWASSIGESGTAAGINNWSISDIPLAEGENIISVQAEDNAGNESMQTVLINHEPLPPGYPLPAMETGEVNIDHISRRVFFSKSFYDPIVIAKPLSLNNSDPAVISAPAVIRVSNVDISGFDISIQEWDYLDGIHPTETVGYFVIERGSYSLEDGTRFEAGSFSTGRTKLFKTVLFNQSFNDPPVVITSISTVNEEDAVSSRVKKVTIQGFKFRMQEQESKDKAREGHITETISYIAWEPSLGSVDGLTFEVGKTDDLVTRKPYKISFNQSFADDAPVFIADMQTADGIDACNVRWKNKTESNVDVLIDEEKSLDREVTHTSEVVGYMLFADQQ